MQRVEAVAKVTGHDYTTALFHLVKWALDEFDRQRTKQGQPPSGDGTGKTESPLIPIDKP
jgi:hypothetical protein